MPFVPLVLCGHYFSGLLYPLFLWSSVVTIFLVYCTHCSSGPLCQCSFSPLYPLFHCSTVPLFHCSTVPLFHCSTVPLVSLSTIPPVFCTHCFSGLMCPLFLSFFVLPLVLYPSLLCQQYTFKYKLIRSCIRDTVPAVRHRLAGQQELLTNNG